MVEILFLCGTEKRAVVASVVRANHGVSGCGGDQLIISFDYLDVANALMKLIAENRCSFGRSFCRISNGSAESS